MKIIWVVEDDYLQREFICQSIKDSFSASLVELRTENGLIKKLDSLVKPYPDLIILDIMLPWEEPEPNISKIPKNIEEDGFYRAGIRCEKLIRNTGEISHIPVIMYTNLAQEDIQSDLNKLGKETVFLEKKSETKELIDTIKNCNCIY